MKVLKKSFKVTFNIDFLKIIVRISAIRRNDRNTDKNIFHKKRMNYQEEYSCFKRKNRFILCMNNLLFIS